MPFLTSWMRVSLVEPPVTLLVLKLINSLQNPSAFPLYPIDLLSSGDIRLEVLQLLVQLLLVFAPQLGGLLLRV